MNPPKNSIYRFADVEVDAARGCLRRNGDELYLRPQTFTVLLYLLEHCERLVTKDELVETLWKDTAVGDDSLVQCVTDIRKALGDDAHHPRFLRTVPRIGYRFIHPVEAVGADGLCAVTEEVTSISVELEEELDQLDHYVEPTAVARAPPAAAPQRWPNHKLVAVAAVVVVLGLVASLFTYLRHRSAISTPRLAATALPHIPGNKAVAVMYFENGSDSTELSWLREGLADMLITDLAGSEADSAQPATALSTL